MPIADPPPYDPYRFYPNRPQPMAPTTPSAPEAWSEDVETRHVAFNPHIITTNHSPLGDVCKAQEADGWRLVEVIPHHMYEAVAVFERTHLTGRT